MTPDHDDETAEQKFEKFEATMKQVLTAPKPPPKPDKKPPQPT